MAGLAGPDLPPAPPPTAAGEWWRFPHGGIVGSAELFEVVSLDESEELTRLTATTPDDLEYLPRHHPGKNLFVFRRTSLLTRPWHCAGGPRLFEVDSKFREHRGK